jgi:hypothetical protein
MTAMKITLDAAMRARDVSPPAVVDESTGDASTGVDSTGDGRAGGGGPEAGVRERAGGQP